MINRDIKRVKIVKKYEGRRASLKKVLADMASSPSEREIARKKLYSLPRDANPCRIRRRCGITGRSRGYYSKFGLGRNKLRETAMLGFIPGLVKASW
jgi:small subunit ribosomal protein S14